MRNPVLPLLVLVALAACTPLRTPPSTASEVKAPPKIVVTRDRFQQTIKVVLEVEPVEGVPHRSRPQDRLYWGASVVLSERAGTPARAFHHFMAAKRHDLSAGFTYFLMSQSVVILADSVRLERPGQMFVSSWGSSEPLYHLGLTYDQATTLVPLEDLRVVASALSVTGQVGREYDFTFTPRQGTGLKMLLATVDSVARSLSAQPAPD